MQLLYVTLTLATAVAEDAGADHFAHHLHRIHAVSRSGSQRQSARMWPFSSSDDSEDKDKDKDEDKDKGKDKDEDEDKPEVVKYGPDACVSTWRSGEGHCIVQTDCEEEDVAKYNFGLVCVDKSGRPVKHVFGEGAFDPSERFNTLISCNECLGLEDIPEEALLNNDIGVVQGMVKELHADMAHLNKGLSRLNAAVFTPAPAANSSAPSPAAADGPAAAPAPAVQFSARRHESKSGGRRVVRHQRKARRHHEVRHARAHAARAHASGSVARHRVRKADSQEEDQLVTVPLVGNRAEQQEQSEAPTATHSAGEEEEAQPETPQTEAERSFAKEYAAMMRKQRIARLQRSRWQAHQGNEGGNVRPMIA